MEYWNLLATTGQEKCLAALQNMLSSGRVRFGPAFLFVPVKVACAVMPDRR